MGSSFYTVYVTPIAADDNGAGLPDLTDNCISVGTATPVVFLAPLNLLINEFCDWTTGIYHITIGPTGGLPQLDGSSYTVIGTNINGQFNVGDQQQIEIPEGELQFYDFALTDGTGCVYTTSNQFICLKTPIELLSYTGEALPTGNLLKWTTATETDNDHFTLARSRDGLEFVDITTVAGAGNSTTARSYEYLDKAAPSGLSYYRLSQTDLSGLTMEKGVVSLQRDATNSFDFVQIVPMPFNEQLEVSFQQGKQTKVKANLFDAVGRLVYTKDVEANVGITSFTLSTEDYPTGMYLLTLNNGETVISAKLMKE